MARIRKIPDTWTLEIHAIVLKDSRQTEHEEIGYTSTTRQRNARNNKTRQKKEMLETTRHDKTKLRVLEHQKVVGEELKRKKRSKNKKTRQDEAQSTRTSNVVGEELKKKETLENKKDTTRRSSAYSNIKRNGRGAQKERNA